MIIDDDADDDINYKCEKEKEKHLYARPGLRTENNLLTYGNYCCYQQDNQNFAMTEEKKDPQDDNKSEKPVKHLSSDTDNAIAISFIYLRKFWRINPHMFVQKL